MDASPEPTEPDEETRTVAQGCPRGTNGDGNCGQPACPRCGQNDKKIDISDTPAVRRTYDTY